MITISEILKEKSLGDASTGSDVSLQNICRPELGLDAKVTAEIFKLLSTRN